MKETVKFVDTFLLTTGIFYSLANIEQILGIIILIVQIMWFAVKIFYKIKDHLADGHLSEEEYQDVNNDIKDFNDEVRK